MTDFDRSLFWPEFAAAGFLRRALVKQTGAAAVAVSVRFDAPDVVRLDGALSKEYLMEFQATDLPRLVEGDTVTLLDDNDAPLVPKMKFQVRQPAMVTDNPGDDQTGYFMRAVLTKI